MYRPSLPFVILLASCTSAEPALAEASSPVAERCHALEGGGIEGGEITSAALVPARPANPEHPELPIAPIPAHCRIALTLRPTSASDIKVEVWLPAAEWNGRFLGVGVGGFGGVINEGELKTAVQRGYAAAATDTGHGVVGTEVWARNQPEKIVDYGHRAIHLMTVAGKALATRFYGSAPHHAYFAGCSNGGRQALMEAARYPGDYDGIIAGAPAADFTGLVVASFGWNDQALRRAPLSTQKLSALQRGVLEQCDALDGSRDDLVGAPEACHFNPAKLRCTGLVDDKCFTDAEIATLNSIYSGPRTSDGRVINAGFSVGGEAPEMPSPGWEGWLVPSKGKPTEQYNFYSRFMRDFLTADPDWKAESFDLERDVAFAKQKLSAQLDSNDPDLSAFARRGGKLILWHGWSDQAIPAGATIRYYDSVVAKMGRESVDRFARLYMAPGVQHCWLGPGPWAFNWSAARPGAAPRTDMAAALEAWVEKGMAPKELVAIRPKNAFSILAGYPPLEVDRSGLLCPYPLIAKYDGKNSPKDAASYSCAVAR